MSVLTIFLADADRTEDGGTSNMKKDIKDLSNADIKWEGTYAGLTPILIGERAKQLSEMGDQVTPELLAALTNEDVFVAAHVILTQLSGIEYQAFPAWNGLVVDIAADGTVTIDPDQRFNLVRRWERWYDTEPRPRVLPSGD
jgi:hypothetical protein